MSFQKLPRRPLGFEDYFLGACGCFLIVIDAVAVLLAVVVCLIFPGTRLIMVICIAAVLTFVVVWRINRHDDPQHGKRPLDGP